MWNVNAFLHIGQEPNVVSHPVVESMDITIPPNMELETRGGSTTISFILDALKLFYRNRMRRLVKDTMQHQFRELVNRYLKGITLEDINNAYYNHDYANLLNSTFIV